MVSVLLGVGFIVWALIAFFRANSAPDSGEYVFAFLDWLVPLFVVVCAVILGMLLAFITGFCCQPCFIPIFWSLLTLYDFIFFWRSYADDTVVHRCFRGVKWLLSSAIRPLQVVRTFLEDCWRLRSVNARDVRGDELRLLDGEP